MAVTISINTLYRYPIAAPSITTIRPRRPNNSRLYYYGARGY